MIERIQIFSIIVHFFGLHNILIYLAHSIFFYNFQMFVMLSFEKVYMIFLIYIKVVILSIEIKKM